jgi:hypothetical protein
MNAREISQIAKKLVQAQIVMTEVELSLNLVKVDESMPFSEREVHILNALRQLADSRALIQSVLTELQKRMTDGPN